MAVKKCCVEDCKSCSARKEDKGVTFHKFPKDATSNYKWQSVTQYSDTQKDLTAYVCSRHFCKRDFQKNKDSKYILKSDAVPSIFPWTIADSIMMEELQSEESLSSITNEGIKDLSSGTKGSETDNLDAIKKFIEEQEKEILESELQEKQLQEKKLQEAELKEKELQEKEQESAPKENELQENEFKEKELQEKESETAENIEESIENVDTSKEENFTVASSVMEMILNNSESKIAEKVTKENAKDVSKPNSEGNEKSNQKVFSPSEKGNASMSLSVGSKVEAKDFSGDWHAAEVAEVDFDEMEVLVRYEIDLKKHDEWITVSSPRLRPFTGNTAKPAPAALNDERDQPSSSKDEKAPAKEKSSALKEKLLTPKEIKDSSLISLDDSVKIDEKPKLVFEVGERCLARWRDNRRFVATIQKDLGDGKFEIIFDDGFQWTCTLARLRKMRADSLTVDTSFQPATAGSPSPMEVTGPAASAPISPALPYHTHLFDPSRDYLGSKSERREKKRKLNIKEIFNIGQKKFKKAETEKEKTPRTPTEKKPRVRKAAAPKEAVVKKEVKNEVPDAVASIIGSVTKEVKIKLEPIPKMYEKRESTPPVEVKDEIIIEADDVKEEVDEMSLDDMEPIGCVVNPNDATLDDEEMEEPKSEEDPVLDEEIKLENFEEQDAEKHEQVIDKIKEAIIKLEDGIDKIEKVNGPKLERVYTPIKEIETPKDINSPELKKEVKAEDLKQALAEVASSIDIGGSNSNTEEKESHEIQMLKKKSDVPKSKKDPSKIKKAKKLRILNHKLSVNRQVEKVKNELEEMKRQFEAMRKRMLEQEYLKSQGQAPLPESCLLPGEWCCRWVNGQPVGKVSEIEGTAQLGHNKSVLPRRSVEVEDKRLPPGWTKHMVRRSVGNSAGKWDVVIVSPEQHGNKKFHVKSEMRNFLENYPDDSLKPYEYALLDFGIHLKNARRMNWVVNTPDGIAEAPETILPADTMCNLSPLVKRKSLNVKKNIIKKEKKRGLMMKDKKRRPIKLKLQRGLHTYNSQLVTGESSGDIQTEPEELMYEQPLMPLEDGYVYVGSLKVQIIENLLRCPADGCFKNFRTKTLLQMHIKHYHRELKAKMGATPKVLDLAYARTKPNMADLHQLDRKMFKVKMNRQPKREEPKILMSDSEISTDGSPTTPSKMEDTAPIIPRIPRSLDSPKLRRALIHKPVKRPRVLLPVRRLEPEQPPPDSIYEDDDFDNQITEPLIDVPSLEQPLDFETAISTHTVTKPLEKKKKGDKKKTFASFSKTVSEDEELFAMNSDDLETRSSFPRSGSPDSKMEIKMAPSLSEFNDDQKDAHLYTYTETGERIKIVQMKREEIINCHCGLREEDGLMVQCELCLCWQHALCYNIQRECDVPAKYTCSICLNPRRGRRSRRFLHDQDRMYEGLLPGAAASDSLRRSHELTGNLIRIEDALHALRVKLYVASKKNHPKLYLWAEDWEPGDISQTQEKLNSGYSDLNVMINGMDKENHPVKQEDDGIDIRTPPSEEQEPDRLSQRDNQIGSQALLSGLLSSPGGASIDLPISTSELERLAKSVQESAEWQRVAAPQPEAAIENGACRERLLRHVQRCQTAIDARLDSIEAQVVELESEDPSFGEHYETAEYYPRIKQTIQMLMRDLDTMEELGVIT